MNRHININRRNSGSDLVIIERESYKMLRSHRLNLNTESENLRLLTYYKLFVLCMPLMSAEKDA